MMISATTVLEEEGSLRGPIAGRLLNQDDLIRSIVGYDLAGGGAALGELSSGISGSLSHHYVRMY